MPLSQASIGSTFTHTVAQPQLHLAWRACGKICFSPSMCAVTDLTPGSTERQDFEIVLRRDGLSPIVPTSRLRVHVQYIFILRQAMFY